MHRQEGSPHPLTGQILLTDAVFLKLYSSYGYEHRPSQPRGPHNKPAQHLQAAGRILFCGTPEQSPDRISNNRPYKAPIARRIYTVSPPRRPKILIKRLFCQQRPFPGIQERIIACSVRLQRLGIDRTQCRKVTIYKFVDKCNHFHQKILYSCLKLQYKFKTTTNLNIFKNNGN